MPTPAPPLRDLLDRAVAAGILSADQAAAVGCVTPIQIRAFRHEPPR